MDVEKLKAASGVDLDAAGVEIKLDRATVARGHAFDETDDSYRRRLVAQIAGASAADALSQPAEIALSAEERGPVAVLEDGTVIRGKAAAEILRLQREVSDTHTSDKDKPAVKSETKLSGLKQDGPTVEEWVLAGYGAKGYPPHGYASRSTDAEIDAAIAAQAAAKSHIPADEQGGTPDETGAGTDGKAAEDTSAAGDQAKHLP